ncbi:hypothetical protein DDSR119_67 [Pseudomonas phage DDSR119]|nr:hypothetical protein DDSR119_67 [Pseudomonas phage DDSR119]
MTTTNPKHNNSWGMPFLAGTTPRKQLQLFYKRMGLSRDDARKAIRHDLRRIRQENGGTYQGKDTLGLGISGLLLMGTTKEGIDYWLDRQIGWPKWRTGFSYPRTEPISPPAPLHPSALEFLQ